MNTGTDTVTPTNMITSPVRWELKQPYGARHVIWVFVILLVLVVTGQRTNMDRMIDMNYQAVSHLVGIAPESQVVKGLSRVGAVMWPPTIATEEDISQIAGFDPERLPMFARIEQREVSTQRMNLQTLQLEATSESKSVLVRPFGYAFDVFIKMVETLEIALWGSLFGIIISVPLAWFAASNYAPNRAAYLASRGTISFLRSTPELIVALFLVLAYGFGPIAGVLALGLHSAGFLGKFYAEDIENADRKPQEALQAIGASKLKTLWYAILPQVMPQYIAYTTYVLDRNLRMATVIGLVGAGGIGQELKGRFDMFQYSHVTTILFAIFVFVFVLDQLSARVRSRMI